MKVAKSDLKEVCAGKRLGPATRAESRATSGKTAGRQRGTKESSEEEAVRSKDDFILSHGRNNNKDLEDKVVFDHSEERLDKLEGKLMEDDEEIVEYEEDEIDAEGEYDEDNEDDEEYEDDKEDEGED